MTFPLPITTFYFHTILAILMITNTTPVLSQNNQTDIIPDISSFVVTQRLDELDKATPIQLDYNQYVQAYIDVYTIKRRDHLSRIIGRSELYFPIFEEYLDKYELPLELKYLAIVESALEPKAKSSSGAMGLWQFLYGASQMFDLKVTSFIDERCDPIKSTDAACKYLEYLYRNFNDWQLALAAYNVGPGEVKKAIIRSGGKTNFWELREYLPKAAQSYVPAFIAANYVMNTFHLYDIKPQPAKYANHDIDTIHLHKSLSFESISNITGLPIKDISLLNPIYTKNFIPEGGAYHILHLPSHIIPKFITEVELAKEEPPTAPQSSNENKTLKKKTHVVARGEFCHKIAVIYRCTTEDILEWNDLSNMNLNAGQELVIYESVLTNPYYFVINETLSIKPSPLKLVSKSTKEELSITNSIFD